MSLSSSKNYLLGFYCSLTALALFVNSSDYKPKKWNLLITIVISYCIISIVAIERKSKSLVFLLFLLNFIVEVILFLLLVCIFFAIKINDNLNFETRCDAKVTLCKY